MTLTHFEALAVGVAAALGLLSTIVAVGWKLSRRVTQFLDDWNGRVERPGIEPKRPGVMERIHNLDEGAMFQINQNREILSRLSRVEAQVNPNGGSSMADKVNSIAQVVTAQPGGTK